MNEPCMCERCKITAKFREITAKIRNKADREWMNGFHDQLVGYVAHLEGVIDEALAEPEKRPIIQLPRKMNDRRRRGH